MVKKKKGISTLADIPEDEVVDINKYSLEDLVGENILIESFTNAKSSYREGDYLKVTAEHDGEIITFATGSIGVTTQLKAYANYLPLLVKVGKAGKRFYLEEPD